MPDPAASMIPALGDLLRYGLSGLALAVLLVCALSLQGFQRRAIEGRVPAERIRPFVHLQYAQMAVAIVVFVVCVIAPHFETPVNNAHRVAFTLSPASMREDVAPRLVVAGGSRIRFQDGTGHDEFAGDRTYQFDISRLAQQSERMQQFILQRHLAASFNAEGRDDDGNTR